jgi:hypothetical protein
MIGLYNLSIEENQYSISSIWVESGPPTELNSIKVGTGVSYLSFHLCRFFILFLNFIRLHCTCTRERNLSFLKLISSYQCIDI